MWSDFDIWLFLAGIGIFLIGLFDIEQALKDLTGRPFKKFLRKQTTNPIKGILTGTIITAILQSSSVVTLMVLAFVGAGILKMKNALGIIFGSNLGTTFTGWIVATLGFKLDIEGFALPFVAIGGIVIIFFSSREKLYNAGRFLFGFGLLFIGLSWMKGSIESFTNHFDISIFAGINAYLFFFIGLGITAIIQSSSATMVIALSALSAGLIPLDAAAALVIGSDLGTTITVVLGGIKGTPAKKQVAAAHVLFNIITDLVALALLYPLLYLITEMVGLSDPLLILVFFHSTFNLMGIFMLLPFINVFARFLEKRFNTDDEEAAEFIDKVPPNVPDAAIEALRNEGLRFSEMVLRLNIKVLGIDKSLFKTDAKLFKSNTYQENYSELKTLEGEMVNYYIKVQNEKMADEESDRLNRVVDAFRNAMQSAKGMKDISHNIKEFEATGNDVKLAMYSFLKGNVNEFYLSLYHFIHNTSENLRFEKLVELKRANHDIYHKFLKETYQQVTLKELSELEISTLMNVNSEIYNANKVLIYALGDLILSAQEARDFHKIPNWNE